MYLSNWGLPQNSITNSSNFSLLLLLYWLGWISFFGEEIMQQFTNRSTWNSGMMLLEIAGICSEIKQNCFLSQLYKKTLWTWMFYFKLGVCEIALWGWSILSVLWFHSIDRMAKNHRLPLCAISSDLHAAFHLRYFFFTNSVHVLLTVIITT